MRARRVIAVSLVLMSMGIPSQLRRRANVSLTISEVRTRAVHHAATPLPVTVPPMLHPLLPWWSTFRAAAVTTGIPASLLRAIAMVESHGNPNAVSKEGAIGLMQLELVVAKQEHVVSRWNPVASILGAARYLEWLASIVNVSAACWATAPGGTAGCAWAIDRVISAYNAGPHGSMQWSYIRRVRRAWATGG